jgi:hypothetical protein
MACIHAGGVYHSDEAAVDGRTVVLEGREVVA